jgi:hypothetical protein
LATPQQPAGAPRAAPPAQGRPAGPPGPTRRRILPLVDLTVKLAKANRRPDLIRRLAVTLRRLAEPEVRVLVVGEYKQGKSTLVNALVGAKVCPVDDDVATAVPTVVKYADAPAAQAVLETDDGDKERREDVPVERIGELVSEAGNPENVRRVRTVEVGIPRDFLKSGLALVDTPGVGGLSSAHNGATMAALPFADAVLFVSDASQELSGPELEFLGSARSLTPNLLCVLTKIDFYPEWRRIHQLDRGHLQRAGVRSAMLPVSSDLRQRALASGDRRLNEESGYPPLITALRDQVAARAEVLAVRSAAHDLLSVLDQLGEAHQAAKAVIADPQRGAEVVAELERAKEQAGQLKSQAARWQQTLNDGFADLSSDIDYDFRMRIREVTQVADEALDKSNPTEIWDEFQGWLQRRVSREVADVYAELTRRTQELVERVAEHFEQAEPDLARVGVESPDEAIQAVAVSALKRQKAGLLSQGLLVLKSSYGGVAMFGAISGMVGVGMAALNPFSVGIGVLLAGKALVDQRQQRLAALRQQAKQAHRKFTEEVNLQVGKNSKDAVRHVQRELRDSFTAVADELQRSISEALTAAQTAVKSDQQQRAKQMAAVETQLKAIAGVRAKVAALAPDLAAPARAGG